MLFVPVGGAEVKESVVPTHVYATQDLEQHSLQPHEVRCYVTRFRQCKISSRSIPTKVSFVVLVYATAGSLPKYGIYKLLR